MKNPNLFALFVSILLLLNANNILGVSGKEIVEPTDNSNTIKSESVLVPVLKGNFKFDGIVDDACWDSLAPLPFVMHILLRYRPRTFEVLFADNVFVYIAGRFFDKEADKISIASKMRDNIGPQEDGFLILFDSFHDHENAVGFRTNAAGVRQDFTIANDGTDGFPWNDTWNTFWDVKSTVNEKGWFTEMRIPLSSLRFKEKDGRVEMGFTCNRFISRKFEIDVFPAIPRTWGFWSFVKPSQAREVILEGIHSKKPFYITPYITGGINQESRLNDAESAYVMNNDPKLTAGLDVKYGHQQSYGRFNH
jgi:hypothetical protein